MPVRGGVHEGALTLNVRVSLDVHENNVTLNVRVSLVGMTATTCAPCGSVTPTLADAIPGTLATHATTEPLPNPTETASWEGPLVFEGVTTGDDRLIEPDALVWDTPLPLRFVKEDVGGHDQAVIVGRIDEITRAGGGAIVGRGVFDLGSEDGREAARLAEGGFQNWVSVDLDEVALEVRVAEDILEGDLEGDVDERSEPDADGMIVVDKSSPGDMLRVVTSARVRGATLVQISAFRDARITLTDALPDPAPLAASAPPPAPPTAWFLDPQLDGPTPLHVGDDGRVYGHLALWGTCHVSYPGQCVTPPRSSTGYAAFRLGAVLTADGDTIPTGKITMGTGHADKALTPGATIAHYDNTGTAVADVAVGDDQHGIWVAGAMRPGVSDEQVRALRASPLSGDWRNGGGGLELVAALAVNVPGFPVPRPGVLVASGMVRSMVAAGIATAGGRRAVTVEDRLSADEVAMLRAVAARERGGLASRVEEFAAGLRATAAAGLRARVDASNGRQN